MQYILERQEEIAEISIKESGKVRLEAVSGEILPTCEKIRYMCSAGEAALAEESRTVPALLLLKKAIVRYHPLGVIGCIGVCACVRVSDCVHMCRITCCNAFVVQFPVISPSTTPCRTLPQPSLRAMALSLSVANGARCLAHSCSACTTPYWQGATTIPTWWLSCPVTATRAPHSLRAV